MFLSKYWTGGIARSPDRSMEVSKGHSSRGLSRTKARTVPEKGLKARAIKRLTLVGEKQQKNQYSLVFDKEDKSEAPKGLAEGTEAPPATDTSVRPADDENLMEKVCEPANIQAALKHVMRNKGAPGADGLAVEMLPAHLETRLPGHPRSVDGRVPTGRNRCDESRFRNRAAESVSSAYLRRSTGSSSRRYYKYYNRAGMVHSQKNSFGAPIGPVGPSGGGQSTILHRARIRDRRRY